MIVDCGGGTVDLTTRKLLNRKQLGEVTERTGDYCGSTFIDREFKNHLRRELGSNTMDSFEKEQYKHLQNIVQHFCENAKLKFTGDETNSYELDLEEFNVLLDKYVSDDVKEKLEKDENLIKFDFETIKSMFDPIVEKIIKMIKMQLDNSREKGSKPSIMFLVGGFSESKYLQKRIKDKFQDQVDNISVPQSPTAAISRGAAMYGLSLIRGVDPSARKGSKGVIGSRVLKHTYGVDLLRPWRRGDPDDKVAMSFFGPSTIYFNTIATRGTVAKIDDIFPTDELTICPCHPFQTEGELEIFYTREYDGKFSDEPGMKSLGKLRFDWSDINLGFNRSATFRLSFCEMEITATVTNDKTGQHYHTYFEINAEN
jgi:molecular chaperone DnaK (HSP70)